MFDKHRVYCLEWPDPSGSVVAQRTATIAEGPSVAEIYDRHRPSARANCRSTKNIMTKSHETLPLSIAAVKFS